MALSWIDMPWHKVYFIGHDISDLGPNPESEGSMAKKKAYKITMSLAKDE